MTSEMNGARGRNTIRNTSDPLLSPSPLPPQGATTREKQKFTGKPTSSNSVHDDNNNTKKTYGSTNVTPSASFTVEELECLLCTETIRVRQRPAGSNVSDGCDGRRPCCNQPCCHACLYRHMTTIWDDALTGGQRPLTCPAGCGLALTDVEIRACLHRHHAHPVWNWVGWLIYVIVWGMRNVFCGPTTKSTEPGSMQSCPRYRVWWYLLHTRNEQRDLFRYERWSISMGFRDLTTTTTTTTTTINNNNNNPTIRISANNSASQSRTSISRRPVDQEAAEGEQTTATTAEVESSPPVPVMIQHCPAPNCDYSWIVADPVHRRHKQANEQRRVLLWFQPPGPEPIDDNEAHQWVEAEYLHFGTAHSPPPPVDWDHPNQIAAAAAASRTSSSSSQRNKIDGRRMVCAKCHYVFCGLCRQPWMFLRHYHYGKSCRNYHRALPPQVLGGGAGDLAAVAAHTLGARMCPGCHTLTSRIDGCNHITCPCGKEWCYVCGASWTSWHYACRSRNADERRLLGNNNNNQECVIL
ncbi:hypothetical protein ACA910_000257 [Epithemia clementina (nom. ined.)]